MQGVLLGAGLVAMVVGLGALMKAVFPWRGGSKQPSVYPSTPG